MEGTGFLKTVNFGGFDKKDVLAYVDELNTKIYTLEAELDEKKALLESADGLGVNNEKYDELLAADKAKITELQTNNDSLKNQMKSLEDELEAKDKEIEELKAQTAELEDQLQEARIRSQAAEVLKTVRLTWAMYSLKLRSLLTLLLLRLRKMQEKWTKTLRSSLTRSLTMLTARLQLS